MYIDKIKKIYNTSTDTMPDWFKEGYLSLLNHITEVAKYGEKELRVSSFKPYYHPNSIYSLDWVDERTIDNLRKDGFTIHFIAGYNISGWADEKVFPRDPLFYKC